MTVRSSLLLCLLVSVAVAACGADTPGPSKAELTKPLASPQPLGGLPHGPQDGHIAWRRNLEGPVVPGPVQGPDGTMFAASNGGVLHAIDPATGKDKWAFSGGGAYGSDLSTSPVVHRGTVIWPGPRSTVFGLDAATGALRWMTAVAGDPHTPAIRDGRIFVQDGSGTLTALDLHGGRRWTVSLGSSSYSSAAVGEDGTVYSAADRTLSAVRGGRVVWRVKTNSLVEVSPAVFPDGTVTIGSNDRRQYGVSPAGKVRWRYDIGDLTYSSPAITADGLAYFGDHRGLVSALDSGGRLRFRVLGKGRTADQHSVGVWTRPAVDADHDVYFGTRPGHVHGFTATGRRLLDVDLGATVDSYPTITREGMLVVGSESGSLTAFGRSAVDP